MEYIEKQISSRRNYTGLIVNVRTDEAELFNGVRVPREVVEHPGGVGIVPLDADGNVIAVRQFRYPMMEMLLEIPAGKLEPGEDPRECAIRELSEETGFSAGELIDLGASYPSPGYCKETLYLYLARDLAPGETHPDENEYLHVEKVPLDTFVEEIMQNEIRDGKTMIGILKTKMFLDREK